MLASIQPLVTNCFVEKPKQAHFYLLPSLRAECEAVFDRQGVSFSEGMSRLVRLLVEAPDDMRPVILGQAHGNAAVAIAHSVVRQHIADIADDAEPKGYRLPRAAKKTRKPPPPKE